jgi:GntR family transcriptional regulator
MVLDQGPTPLYHQLKNILKARILSSELKGKDRLPTETELCTEYGVSRITVRQALSELIKEGLIYRDRGRGSFVTEGAEMKRLSLRGTIENLIASGKGSRIRVVRAAESVPPTHVMKVLQLRAKQKVLGIEILRFIPKGPFGYSYLYFPPDLAKIISPEELGEDTEVITLVESKMRTKVNRANQMIDVGLADPVTAKHLSIKPRTPLLIIERDYFARNGSPMFATVTYFRPDLYKYRIELTRA